MLAFSSAQLVAIKYDLTFGGLVIAFEAKRSFRNFGFSSKIISLIPLFLYDNDTFATSLNMRIAFLHRSLIYKNIRHFCIISFLTVFSFFNDIHNNLRGISPDRDTVLVQTIYIFITNTNRVSICNSVWIIYSLNGPLRSKWIGRKISIQIQLHASRLQRSIASSFIGIRRLISCIKVKIISPKICIHSGHPPSPRLVVIASQCGFDMESRNIRKSWFTNLTGGTFR